MTSKENDFDGQVAVVTGGGSGIGLAIAHRLAESGASVVVVDVNEEAADAAVAALPESDRHLVLKANVSRSVEVDAFVAAVVERYGRLDVLVNNAGAPRVGPHTQDVSDEDWDATINVLQHGVFYGMRAVAPVMFEQGSGSVVNIASIRGFEASPGRLAYCAAKAAVVMMTRVTAVEWGPRGVRVNAVAPGMIRTPLWQRVVDAGEIDPERLNKTVPLRRVGEPEDIADGVAFLASDQARYITGELLTIDGGLTQNTAA
jgi:NAD(P)-dependent dehydrogenase (short-subunit alcohol dehydrogenase family)